MNTKEHKDEHHHKDESEKKESEGKNDSVDIPVGKYMTTLRKNPWIIATVVLAIALVVVLIFGRGFGGGINANTAGENAVKFLNNNPSLEGVVTLISSEKASDMGGQFYKVTVAYNGQEIPVYTTLDGKFLVANVMPLEVNASAPDSGSQPSDSQPTVVPKSDKPVVEVFVMSYCPYGTQIEKGILPVAKQLGSKIDFSIKFVNYAMHGEKEVTENTKQYCLQKEQPSKFQNYLTCFLNNSNSDACVVSAGVDKIKMNACVIAADKQYDITKYVNDKSTWLSGAYIPFMIDDAANKAYGVQGSPTLVINGAQASAGRDSQSLLKAVCAAFNNAPAECNQALSSEQPSPGF